MKTLSLKNNNENFKEFALTNDEMFAVRGGTEEGVPTVLPNPPRIKI